MKQDNDDEGGVLEVLEQHTKAVTEGLAAQSKAVKDLDTRLNAEAEIRMELERKFNRSMIAFGGGVAVVGSSENAIDEFKRMGAARFPQRGRYFEGLSASEYSTYRDGFVKYLRHGERELNADEQKAMSIGADPEGGFLVTPDFGKQIITIEHANSVVRQVANELRMGSDAAEFIENTGRPTVGWVGEAQARSATNTPNIGKHRFESKEIYANPGVTQKLLEDSAIDVEAFLADGIGLEFAEEEDAKFIAGDGILVPRGFTTYDTSTVSDTAGTRSFGTIQHIATGVSGDWPATDAALYDKLVDVVHALRPRYRQRAEWMMGTAAVARLRKMKDGQNNPIWQTSLIAGQPDRLLGYPVREAEQMPTIAANSLSVAFADWKRAYWILDRTGVRVLRDPYSNKPYVHFYTTKRMAGGVADSCAIKLLKFATS
jgi:HK97 family phage major capsid protein